MGKKKNRKRHRNNQRMCDPGMCDNCIYLSEGDFICDKFTDTDGGPVLVMADWGATENYMRCSNGS